MIFHKNDHLGSKSTFYNFLEFSLHIDIFTILAHHFCDNQTNALERLRTSVAIALADFVSTLQLLVTAVTAQIIIIFSMVQRNTSTLTEFTHRFDLFYILINKLKWFVNWSYRGWMKIINNCVLFCLLKDNMAFVGRSHFLHLEKSCHFLHLDFLILKRSDFKWSFWYFRRNTLKWRNWYF